MKVLIFGGSGRMGRAVAYDLVRERSVEAVGLVGRSRERLASARDWLKNPKVVLHALDVSDRTATKALMREYNVGVNTVPDRRTSYATIHAAVECGFSMADMLEEYHRTPDLYETEGLALPDGMSLAAYGEWLHQTAVANGVTIVDGIGFAPGLSNITCGDGMRKLDAAESAVARVGGIPSPASAAGKPLRYMITWAFEHVLREYVVKLNIRKEGQVVEVAAGTGRESFRFDRLGRDALMECAITPGMPSFITTRPELREFAEKTVRWPGHWEGVDTLKECGLLGTEPVEHRGAPVVPREFLLTLIEPRLRPRPGDIDVCVMYNTVRGTKSGRPATISYWMWEEADASTGISAMGRVTAFPAAIAAVMVGKGEIAERGLVAPEDCIHGELYGRFMEQLGRRGIRVQEEIGP